MKKKNLFVLIFFLFLSCLVTYPLIFRLTTSAFGRGDELLITWIVNWNIHALLHNLFHIFDANIFYPYRQTLSFSEPFFTSSLIALVPVVLWKEPLLGYNINVIVSLAMLGFAVYYLVYFLTGRRSVSILSGILVAFSPFTLGRIFQLQVVSIQWIPFGILYFIKFLDERKTRYFLLACLFLLLQTGNSFLTGYFTVLCYLVILVFFILAKRTSFKPLIRLKTVFIAAVFLSIVALFGGPYFSTSGVFHYVRDIRDTVHFANRPEYTLYPNNRTRLSRLLLNAFYSRDTGPFRYDGYWGLAFMLTFVVSAIGLLKLDKKNALFPRIFFVIAASGFVLSLGPAWQWGGHVIKHPFIIPLPYALLYYLIPGFKGIRNSARWEMLTILAAGIFVGLMLNRVFKRKNRLFCTGITFAICLATLMEINWPFSYVQIPDIKNFPAVYSYLDTLPPDTAVIHLPIFSWDMQPYSNKEFLREYFGTIHFRRTVNGYSGFSPKEWEQNTKLLTARFPDPETVEYLQKIKVDYIIVHKNDYDELSRDKYEINKMAAPAFDLLMSRIPEFPQLQFIKKIDNDFVFKLNKNTL